MADTFFDDDDKPTQECGAARLILEHAGFEVATSSRWKMIRPTARGCWMDGCARSKLHGSPTKRRTRAPAEEHVFRRRTANPTAARRNAPMAG